MPHGLVTVVKPIVVPGQRPSRSGLSSRVVTWILVTNDDGADAPSLPPLATAMAAVAEVRVVVPHIERSWVGKAITRFETVVVQRTERSGVTLHTTTGFPADCVQLGIHALFDDEPPALVVSGINVGYNHGSAYLQSSGTVGACLEGAIAGVPGLALSTGSRRPWPEWRRFAHDPESIPMWSRLADVAIPFAEAMLAAAPRRQILSVNLPDTATTATPWRVTRVADVGYDRLFAETSPGQYVHRFGGMLTGDESLDGTDVGAAADDVISITPIVGSHTGALPEELRAALDTG